MSPPANYSTCCICKTNGLIPVEYLFILNYFNCVCQMCKMINVTLTNLSALLLDLK